MTQAPPTTSLSPRDERVNKQRAQDARVQRVRKIEALAEACQDPACQAIASFSMLGEGFVLTRDQTLEIATEMLKIELADHAADQGAGPLPKQLDWAIEMAEAGKRKSPSMAGPEGTPEKQDPNEDQNPQTGRPIKEKKKK